MALVLVFARMKPVTSTPPPSPAADGWIDAAYRRRVSYLHLQELLSGRDVVEAWSGRAEAQASQLLVDRCGARRVSVVAPQGAETIGTPERTGLPDASADVVLAIDVEAASLGAVVREALRVLRPDGTLVLGVPSRDRPGAQNGASYYDVVDACGAFDRVQMIGVAPFAGATLVEYGVADPEPIIDGTLVGRGERVEHYLAVAGPDRRGDFGYGVVQIPVSSISMRGAMTAPASGSSARGDDELRATIQAAKRPPAREEARPTNDDAARRALAEAMERHASEMRARETELHERDAYIRELEGEGRHANELLGRLARLEASCALAEAMERDARKKIAELEGRLLRGAVASSPAVAPAAPGNVDELATLKTKLAAAETESWKQLKARSDAEAATAEMRDDMVRKLKDARKLATVELTRAMEEATKKAVSLRDELSRSEAERKAALEQLRALQTAPVIAAASGAESPELQARLKELELELERRDAAVERAASAAAHERARAERLVTSERQALAERNDARARGAEINARVAGLEAERDRATFALQGCEEKLRQAETESEGRRERVRKLKRELLDCERRAASGIQRARMLEVVRARVQALEAAVAGEARRVAGIEEALRAAP